MNSQGNGPIAKYKYAIAVALAAVALVFFYLFFYMNHNSIQLLSAAQVSGILGTNLSSHQVIPPGSMLNIASALGVPQKSIVDGSSAGYLDNLSKPVYDVVSIEVIVFNSSYFAQLAQKNLMNAENASATTIYGRSNESFNGIDYTIYDYSYGWGAEGLDNESIFVITLDTNQQYANLTVDKIAALANAQIELMQSSG